MDYGDKNVMLTRWGGYVQLFLREVSASNSASIEYYMFKLLAEMGYNIHIYGNISKTGRDEVLSKAEPWYEKIILHEDYPADIPEYISHCFVVQQTENFRFGGANDIPGQFWIYRHLRRAKVPVIYLQYDAYTPMFLPPENRGEPCAIWGASIRDFCASNVFIMSAGQNKEKMEELGYKGTCGHLDFITWEKDIHAPSIASIDTMSMEPQIDPKKQICFVGKDRRGGSRSNAIFDLMEALNNDLVMNDYRLALYGKWDKFFEGPQFRGSAPHYHPGVYAPGPIRGADQVMKVYNESEFGLMPGNDFNREFRQYTVRIPEILSAGTIPIIERAWLKTWLQIFTPDIAKELYAISYREVSDIPEVMEAAHEKYSGENRVNFINAIRKSIRTVVSDDYIKEELQRTLDYTASKPLPDEEYVEQKARQIIKAMYLTDMGSKLSRVRDAAQGWRARRMEQNFGDNYTQLANTEDMRKHYIFANSNLTDDQLRQMFGR